MKNFWSVGEKYDFDIVENVKCRPYVGVGSLAGMQKTG